MNCWQWFCNMSFLFCNDALLDVWYEDNMHENNSWVKRLGLCGASRHTASTALWYGADNPRPASAQDSRSSTARLGTRTPLRRSGPRLRPDPRASRRWVGTQVWAEAGVYRTPVHPKASNPIPKEQTIAAYACSQNDSELITRTEGSLCRILSPWWRRALDGCWGRTQHLCRREYGVVSGTHGPV